MEEHSPTEPADLPPAVVSEADVHRCEWCGRSLSVDVSERDLSADLGRRAHRYLSNRYRVCGDECRESVVRFIRRHLFFGPVLWALTLLSFLIAVVVLARILPPPLRIIPMSDGTLVGLRVILGFVGILAGTLVAIFPYTFVARRPDGDPPVVPLRRTRRINRALGIVMAFLCSIIGFQALITGN